jgi:hypothetical protein
MSNPTIVSIRVGQRFTVGETWYWVDSGYAEKVTLLDKPFWQPNLPGSPHGAWRIRIVNEYGFILTPSLGDAGVTGYTYDSRPSKLVRTEEDCVPAIRAFDDWLWDQEMSHFEV